MSTNQAPTNGGNVSGGDPIRERGRGGVTGLGGSGTGSGPRRVRHRGPRRRRHPFGEPSGGGSRRRAPRRGRRTSRHGIGHADRRSVARPRGARDWEVPGFQGSEVGEHTFGRAHAVLGDDAHGGDQRRAHGSDDLRPRRRTWKLGRHPTRAWMDVIPVCLGIADRHSRILSISAEVYELLAGFPPNASARDCWTGWIRHSGQSSAGQRRTRSSPGSSLTSTWRRPTAHRRVCA